MECAEKGVGGLQILIEVRKGFLPGGAVGCRLIPCRVSFPWGGCELSRPTISVSR